MKSVPFSRGIICSLTSGGGNAKRQTTPTTKTPKLKVMIAPRRQTRDQPEMRVSVTVFSPSSLSVELNNPEENKLQLGHMAIVRFQISGKIDYLLGSQMKTSNRTRCEGPLRRKVSMLWRHHSYRKFVSINWYKKDQHLLYLQLTHRFSPLWISNWT